MTFLLFLDIKISLATRLKRELQAKYDLKSELMFLEGSKYQVPKYQSTDLIKNFSLLPYNLFLVL